MCTRCLWLDQSKEDYIRYHDDEWGIPVLDDQTLFEFITLESAQAGLSWYTILKKRNAYTEAFYEFNVQRVAQMNHGDVARLLNESSIVRNEKKIIATINNARAFIDIQNEFGSFAKYQWQFVDYFPIVNHIASRADYQSHSEISVAFAKDLKRRGFKFLGPTTVYAHMQACGMVNDHDNACFRKEQIITGYEHTDFEALKS
ncbi:MULTISPECIES: DNA-3-methyladenine glycosylase I [Pseudoalteromonas]|uniref:DNA-3-methyladenine glycosylase n=1 Tax=Pseudoalteromonas amylolytica TaxID=1859457 RepID=A0A1S1MUX6_9GAMM|nr:MULTISPECIES: DNA-3-methyladenine glycosylase I [Pseudoalteromonas]MCF6434707.1 DNA-3-methyladenine glycosylase I [Pseudoalteromonas sp. MMG022]OHU87578.1 DNA-3-methyladenine glycosylase [Pseudoalteromonas sp. JW3]OHU91021.1 DNA-3-methyladenine glycosylase [Pseudoalteromonas amylolytica]